VTPPRSTATTIYRSDSDSLVMVIGPGTGPTQLTAAVSLLSDAAREPCRRLVLDVGHLHRLSSDLLALLLWANTQLQTRGCHLAVARPSPATRDLLHRTGLDHVLSVLDRLPEEVAA
jgi:anti-anti-sigma factor